MSFASQIGGLTALTELEVAKAEKLDRLAEKKAALDPYKDLSKNTYTELADGTIESNSNKVWNDLSREELAGLSSAAMSTEALGRRADGSLYNLATGQDYTGKASYLYSYGTKGDDETTKIGIARGDLPSADYRYQPGRAREEGLLKAGAKDYGWDTGEYGATTDKKLMEVLLPENTAKLLEGLYHGNKGNLGNRLYTQNNEGVGSLLGSGKSEYYSSRDVLLGKGDPSKYIDINKGKSLLESYKQKVYGAQQGNSTLTPEQEAAAIKNYQADNMDVLGRLANTAKGLGKSLVQNAVVDAADWAGETLKRQTGYGWDVGSEEEKSKMVSDWFGYNEVLAQRGMERAKVHAEKIYEGLASKDKDVNISDVYELIKTGLFTPEMLGESLGYIGAMVVPVLGWTRAGRAMSAMKQADKYEDMLKIEIKKGNMTQERLTELGTKVAEYRQKANDLDKLEGIAGAAKKLAVGNAGFMNVVAGDTNDTLDERMANNNGEQATVGEVIGVMATATAMAGLDKLAFSKTFDPKLAEGIKEAISYVPENQVGKVVMGIAKSAGALAAAGSIEAAQEYTQVLGEQLNKQYGTDKYSGQNLLDLALSKENQVEAIAGAGMGAAMGGEINLASQLGSRDSALGQALGTVAGGVGTAIGSTTAAVGNAVNAGKKAYSEMVGIPEDTTLTSAREVIKSAATNSVIASPKAPGSTISTEEGGSTDIDITDRLAQLRAQMAARGLVVKEGADSQAVNKEAVNTVTTILGSDEKSLDKFKQYGLDLEDIAADVIASGDKESAEQVTKAVANSVKGNPEGDAIYEEWLARVTEKSNAIRVLGRLENLSNSATGKTQGQVTQEATIGDIGFLSHYNAAKITNAAGDLDSRNLYTAALDRMRKNAEIKLSSFEGAVTQVEGVLENRFAQQNPTVAWKDESNTLTPEAIEFLKNYVAVQEAKQRKGERLEFVTSKYNTTNYNNEAGETQTFALNGYLGAKDLLARNGLKGYEVRSKNAGAFKLVNQVREELGAMNVLYDSLIKEFSGERSTVPTQATSTVTTTATNTESEPVVTPTAAPTQAPTQDLSEVAKQADTFENDLPVSNQANSDMESELVTDRELDNIWGSYSDSDIDSVSTGEWEPEFAEPPKDPSRKVENFGRVTASYGTKVDALGNEVVNTDKGVKDVRVTLEIEPGKIEDAGSDNNVTKYRIIGKEAFKDVLTGLAQADKASGDTRSIDWLQGHMKELDMMLEVVGDVEFTVGIIKPQQGGKSIYNPNTGEIVLRANADGYSASGTLLRELVHKLTYRGLEANPELKNRVNKLREMVIDRIPAQHRDKVREYAERFANQEEGVFNDMAAEGLDKYYGLLNEHELMTETVSNPEFRNVLMNISVGAFDKIYRLVTQLLKALFGKQEGEVVNALDDARDLLAEALVVTKMLDEGTEVTKFTGAMADAAYKTKVKKEIDRKAANDIIKQIKEINPKLAEKVKANMALVESENYNIVESSAMSAVEALKFSIIQEFKKIGECQ